MSKIVTKVITKELLKLKYFTEIENLLITCSLSAVREIRMEI